MAWVRWKLGKGRSPWRRRRCQHNRWRSRVGAGCTLPLVSLEILCAFLEYQPQSHRSPPRNNQPTTLPQQILVGVREINSYFDEFFQCFRRHCIGEYTKVITIESVSHLVVCTSWVEIFSKKSGWNYRPTRHTQEPGKPLAKKSLAYLACLVCTLFSVSPYRCVV